MSDATDKCKDCYIRKHWRCLIDPAECVVLEQPFRALYMLDGTVRQMPLLTTHKQGAGMKTQLDEGRDKGVINGWFEQAKKVRLGDGSLDKFLRELNDNYRHDYGTTCHAIAAAAIAAAYAMAHEMGPTGFQFSCAEMEFLARSRFPHNKLGFSVCDWDDVLYPQYANRFTGLDISGDTAERIKAEAKRRIDEGGAIHPTVKEWWSRLAAGDFPEWLRVEADK